MDRSSLSRLSNDELLAALRKLVATSNEVTAELVAHLGEVDARGIYRDAGYSSLFAYCVDALRLSEPAAFRRIRASRAARDYPLILRLLASGDLHLSGVTALAPHLTPGNHAELLQAAVHRTKREIEELLAARFPQPDAPTVVRRLPEPRPAAPAPVAPPALPTDRPPAAAAAPPPVAEPDVARPIAPTPPAHAATPALASTALPRQPPASAADPVIVPTSAERYRVQFTAPRTLRDKLREAQDLLGHQVPDGDVAVVLERALDALLVDLRRRKFAETESPRAARELRERPSGEPGRRTRHIPNPVKREVARRDGHRCTYVAPDGRRCNERRRLEFHHLEPFARGGPHTALAVTLRCAGHNALAAEQDFGPAFIARRRAAVGRESPDAGSPDP